MGWGCTYGKKKSKDQNHKINVGKKLDRIFFAFCTCESRISDNAVNTRLFIN